MENETIQINEPIKKESYVDKVVVKVKNLWRNHKYYVSAGVVVVTLILVVGTVLLFRGGGLDGDNPNDSLTNLNSNGVDVVAPQEPRDQVLPINGALVTKTEFDEISARMPLAIVVENHPDARPQSGLDKADIVFETLVEGGITRFVPVFQTQMPEVVGPVRSARKYFLDLIAGFGDSMIMHIGGASSTNPEADAYGEIAKQGIKSLGVDGGQFWRVSDRYAPHNAYTSTVDLWKRAEDIGWVGPVDMTPWKFQDHELNIEEPIVTRIQVNWNGWGQNIWSVIWDYDSEKNVYKRNHLTEPHADAVTGSQLAPVNIAVVYAPMQSAGDGTARIVYDVFGSGQAKLFRDGAVVNGTWEKAGRTSRLLFKDESGESMKFNRGQTWIMVVPDNSEVNY